MKLSLINVSLRTVQCVSRRTAFVKMRVQIAVSFFVLATLQLVTAEDRYNTSQNTIQTADFIESESGSFWLTGLSRIEERLQPSVLHDGPRKYSSLSDYYWASNQELRRHVDGLIEAFLDGRHQHCRGLTLVAGTAGVGKTFIKSGLFRSSSKELQVKKFDIRDWYVEFIEKGLAEYQADIVTADHPMCQLLKLTGEGRSAFVDRLASIEQDFLLVDSLDEVHPDDYAFVLDALQNCAAKERSVLGHVFVFGRPLAFREYWNRCCKGSPLVGHHCFVLSPPSFRSTGDLMVSSWNYHCWKYKLREQEATGEYRELPLSRYEEWREDGFQHGPAYDGVTSADNHSMRSDVQDTLDQWAREYPCVSSVLGNLAGNSMVREIVEESVLKDQPFSEKRFKEEFFAKWLERDTLSGDRPSRLKPRDLEVYVKLLESVALQYAETAVKSGDGFFSVAPDDEAVTYHDGREVRVSVERLLNRSGLVNLDAQQPGDAKYRFEPVWFHSWLIQKSVDRSSAPGKTPQIATVQANDS